MHACMNPQHLYSRINPHRLKHRMPLNSPQFPTTVREFTHDHGADNWS